MDSKFNAVLSISIIPKIMELIVTRESLDENSALTSFYESKTYELLSDKNTEIWHYSPMTLYQMWKEEKEKGVINFPEEL